MGSDKRIPIFAANWKMHKTEVQAKEFMASYLDLVGDISGREVIIAPPFTSIPCMGGLIEGKEHLFLAAQNMHYESHGAFTGEVSAQMLTEHGVSFVILGHSERRHIFGEDDGLIAKKVDAAISSDLCPIFCIGETLDEREKGETFSVLERQLSEGLSSVQDDKADEIVVAYEPVWAIGTGKTASAEQAQEAHAYIRSWLGQRFNSTVAQRIRILYGGSVKPANIQALMAKVEIDGVLVGGASLEPQSFLEIVNYN